MKLKPQTRRVLDELRAAGSFGRTRVDFLHADPPVLNVAARVLELRAAGYVIVGAGRRHACKVYRLACREPAAHGMRVVAGAQERGARSPATSASSSAGVVAR